MAIDMEIAECTPKLQRTVRTLAGVTERVRWILSGGDLPKENCTHLQLLLPLLPPSSDAVLSHIARDALRYPARYYYIETANCSQSWSKVKCICGLLAQLLGYLCSLLGWAGPVA